MHTMEDVGMDVCFGLCVCVFSFSFVCVNWVAGPHLHVLTALWRPTKNAQAQYSHAGTTGFYF
jgi:hypothetical protein